MTETFYFSVAGAIFVFGLGILGYNRSLHSYEGPDVFVLLCLVTVVALTWPVGGPGYCAQRVGQRLGKRSARIKQEREEARHRRLLEEHEEQLHIKEELLKLESELE